MAALALPQSSGIQYAQRSTDRPRKDEDAARILGEITDSGRRPAAVLRLAVVPLEALEEGPAAAELRLIGRRCREHLACAGREWVRRGGQPHPLAERLRALGPGCEEPPHDPERLLVAALRRERTLVGADRTTDEARAFVEELDRQLEALARAYQPTPLTVMDHERAVRVARGALVEAHLSIPLRCARHARRFARVPFEDLVQAGNEALVQAAAAFDWRRGAPFPAYAHTWIKGSINRYERHGDLVLLPVDVHAARGRVRKALAAADSPGSAQIANTVGLPTHAVEAIARSQEHVSIELAMHVRMLVDPAPRPAEILEALEETAAVRAALERCGPRERQVLMRHYGIGCTQMTMRALALSMGLTTQRLYQIKRNGLRQMKQHAAGAHLREAA